MVYRLSVGDTQSQLKASMNDHPLLNLIYVQKEIEHDIREETFIGLCDINNCTHDVMQTMVQTGDEIIAVVN